MSRSYILCVDDEKSVLSSLKHELSRNLDKKCRFEVAESGEEGLKILGDILKAGYDVPLVISDQLMPGMKGDQFLIQVNQLDERIRKIMLTGQADATAVGNALNHANLFRFISKPWNPDDLKLTVEKALSSYYLEQSLDRKVQTLTLINRYAELLAGNLDLHNWLHTLTTNLLQNLDITHCLVQLFPESKPGEKLVFHTYQNGNSSPVLYELDAESLAARYPLSVLAHVREACELVYEPNLLNSDWSEDPVLEQHQIRTVCCLPLKANNRLQGILYLDSRLRAKSINEDQLELLEAVSRQASLALESIFLYHSLEQKVAQRTEDIREDHSRMSESIEVGSRLQTSVLPKIDDLRSVFPNSFIIYRPRDVLSGDFFWFGQSQGLYFIVSSDCTGHGVPGALLSIIGINLLNQIIKVQGLTQPAAILEELDRQFSASVTRTDSGAIKKEGMDLSLCAIDTQNRRFTYAGARQPMIYVENDQALTLKPTKRSINSDTQIPFEEVEVNYQPASSIYLFSDGLVDQFDSKNSKKFTIKRLEELLVLASKQSMLLREGTIRNRLDVWRGQTPQTDDQLLIGIQLD